MKGIFAACAWVFGTVWPCAAGAIALTEDFSGPLSSTVWDVHTDPSYFFSVENGSGVFVKSAGPINGSVELRSRFEFDGDFSVSVDIDGRTDGPLRPGLHLSWADGSGEAMWYFFGPVGRFAGIYFNDNEYYKESLVRTSTKQHRFKIDRTGTSLSLAVDTGSGSGYFVQLAATNDLFLGAVVARLVAYDSDPGPNGNGAGAAYFDNFLLQAAQMSPVPEPGTRLMWLPCAALLLWTARANRLGDRQPRHDGRRSIGIAP